MKIIDWILPVFSCFGFGFLSSAGVFTVFVTVGLLPRLADKTHTAGNIREYESRLVWGAIGGCLLSVFPIKIPSIIKAFLPSGLIMSIFGSFAGIFVGCFAIAIAEMLNTIPIFSRRISMGRGLGIALLFLALGKTAGALLYFFVFYA